MVARQQKYNMEKTILKLRLRQDSGVSIPCVSVAKLTDMLINNKITFVKGTACIFLLDAKQNNKILAVIED